MILYLVSFILGAIGVLVILKLEELRKEMIWMKFKYQEYKEIEKEIIDQYNRETIPIINEQL